MKNLSLVEVVKRALTRPGQTWRRASLRADVRGRCRIYATPPALTGYLARSVHRLLQAKLGWSAGLADARVRLLDPAAGSMNFLRAAAERQMSAPGEEDSPNFSGAPEISPEERELRAEIAQIASEGGRFASRLTRIVLELLAQGRAEKGDE